MKEFKSDVLWSWIKAFYVFIGFSIIIAGTGLFFIYGSKPNKPQLGWIIFILGLSFSLWLALLILVPIKVIVDDEKVQIKRKKRILLNCSFEDYYVSSLTEKTRMNSIPIGTNRFITVTPRYNQSEKKTKPKRYICANFSSKEFSAMMSVINAKQRIRWNKMQGIDSYENTFGNSSLLANYTVPKDAINHGAFRNKQRTLGILGFIVFEALAIWTAVDSMPWNITHYPIFQLSLAAIFQCVALIILIIKLKKWSKLKTTGPTETPAEVEIYTDHLTIDGQIYKYVELDGIVASPPNYISDYVTEDRYLKILKRNSSQPIVYRFGTSQIRSSSNFQDYEAMCDCLSGVLAKSGLFTYQL